MAKLNLAPLTKQPTSRFKLFMAVQKIWILIHAASLRNVHIAIFENKSFPRRAAVAATPPNLEPEHNFCQAHEKAFQGINFNFRVAVLNANAQNGSGTKRTNNFIAIKKKGEPRNPVIATMVERFSPIAWVGMFGGTAPGVGGIVHMKVRASTDCLHQVQQAAAAGCSTAAVAVVAETVEVVPSGLVRHNQDDLAWFLGPVDEQSTRDVPIPV